jgi:hypothetical protein
MYMYIYMQLARPLDGPYGAPVYQGKRKLKKKKHFRPFGGVARWRRLAPRKGPSTYPIGIEAVMIQKN